MNKFIVEYTNEMRLQDSLWQSASENLEVMKHLQTEIIKKAKQHEKLKNYYYITYIAAFDEVLTEAYKNETAMYEDEENYFSCGNCKALIENLKELSK